MKTSGTSTDRVLQDFQSFEASQRTFSQMLVGRAAREPETVGFTSFQRAVQLRPNEGQFLIWLGYAMVGANEPSLLAEAERILKNGIQRDPNSGIAFSQLAIAQGRQGKQAEADVSTAQGMMMAGDFQAAKRYAARAQKNLKPGTPAWILADDILTYTPPALNR